jgi:hypothetical protein
MSSRLIPWVWICSIGWHIALVNGVSMFSASRLILWVWICNIGWHIALVNEVSMFSPIYPDLYLRVRGI